MVKRKFRYGLFADIRWVFDDAECMQGCLSPEDCERNQKKIQRLKREVIKLIRGEKTK